MSSIGQILSDLILVGFLEREGGVWEAYRLNKKDSFRLASYLNGIDVQIKKTQVGVITGASVTIFAHAFKFWCERENQYYIWDTYNHWRHL